MLSYRGKKLISGGPKRKSGTLPGAVYSKAFEGKTARDASIISGISGKHDFAALWDAASQKPSAMYDVDGRPFAWEDNGVTYSSDCLAFEKNMVG